MKIKGKAVKSLIEAAIITANVLLAGCNLPSNIDNVPSVKHVINSLITNDENDNASNNIYYDENRFIDFETEKMYTLFANTQLYDMSTEMDIISPNTINRQTMVVRGIATDGIMTLIELPNGNRTYVDSNDIVKTINFDIDKSENIMFNYDLNGEDYTVNKNAYVYNRYGVCYGHINEGVRCLEIVRTSGYVFVITENDEYFYIKESDITLTKEYKKGLFSSKKLVKTEEQLDSRNALYDRINNDSYTHQEVIFNNEVFEYNEEEPYRTLLREHQHYYRNGSLEPVVVTEGLRVKVIKESDNLAYVEFDDGSYGYVNKRNLCSSLDINRENFSPILRNRNMITNDWDDFYDMTGAYQYCLTPNTECTALETDGTYTLIEFPNGTRGYLEYSNLIPAENQVSRYVYIKKGARFFHKNNDGILEERSDDYYQSETIQYLLFIEGDYAYIGDYRGIDCDYVRLSDVDFNYNIEEILHYGYVSRDTYMYDNIDGTGQSHPVDDFDLYWIYYRCGEYTYVRNERNWDEGGYFVKSSEVTTLPEEFYFVDLDEQRLYYYYMFYNRYTTKEWPTRTGNDNNPTHEGIFDIDWKAKDWEFTTFRGSYAHYWIPYNEYGEGFHDLIGDDEQNYGNEAYHQYGSHGCVRVPLNASEYIYNNSPVGTMVLVNRK